MGTFVRVVYYIAFVAILGGLFYLLGIRLYFRQKKIDAFERVEKFLLEQKERIGIEKKIKEDLMSKMAKDIKEIKVDVASINTSDAHLEENKQDQTQDIIKRTAAQMQRTTVVKTKVKPQDPIVERPDQESFVEE